MLFAMFSDSSFRTIVDIFDNAVVLSVPTVPFWVSASFSCASTDRSK